MQSVRFAADVIAANVDVGADRQLPGARTRRLSKQLNVNVPDDDGDQDNDDEAQEADDERAGERVGLTLLLRPPADLPPMHKALWEGANNVFYQALKSNPEQAFKVHVTSDPPLPEVANLADPHAVLKALLGHRYLQYACSPVSIAAAAGDKALLQKLLNVGRDVSMRDLHLPPATLPKGVPWVTPLAAAALSGDAECVKLLIKKMGRAAVAADKSCYGQIRFRPVVVAQSAIIVELLSAAVNNDKHDALLKLGIAKMEALRKRVDKLARKVQAATGSMPVLSTMGSGGSGAADTPAGGAADTPVRVNGVLTISASFRASPGPGPDTDTDYGMLTNASAFANGGAGRAASSFLQDASGLPQHDTVVSEWREEARKYDERLREQQLLRARVFADCSGRALERALLNYDANTELALHALGALLRAGLDPNTRSLDGKTTLLMTIVSSYQSVLVRLGDMGPDGTGKMPGRSAGALSSMKAYLSGKHAFPPPAFFASGSGQGNLLAPPPSPGAGGLHLPGIHRERFGSAASGMTDDTAAVLHAMSLEQRRFNVQLLLNCILAELLAPRPVGNHAYQPASVDGAYDNGMSLVSARACVRGPGGAARPAVHACMHGWVDRGGSRMARLLPRCAVVWLAPPCMPWSYPEPCMERPAFSGPLAVLSRI